MQNSSLPSSLLSSTLNLTKQPIKNVLLDINGVLFNSGIEAPIEGSVKALELLEKYFNVCLITNECTTAKRLLAKKLNLLGFTSINANKIISPAPVACEYIVKNNLNAHFQVTDCVLEDFKQAIDNCNKQFINEDKSINVTATKKNCLVVGDIMEKLSRDVMDESLMLMLECQQERSPVLVSLGAGRYYKDSNMLRMDTGAYVAAFEFALGVKAINFGKPSAKLFELALATVGGSASDTLMIGDDIVSDVGGAQALGMRAALVRTGKFKPSDEHHASIIPNSVFDNLEHAAKTLIQSL